MFFIGLIVKNLWRQKVRSLLAILGISIGIASIIALGAIANGMEQNLISALKSAKADFTIGQANAPAIVLSSIPAARLKEIQSLPDVAEAYGSLVSFANLNENPYFVVIGANPDSFELAGIQIRKGMTFESASDNQLLLGKVAASTLNLNVGQTVKLDGREFKLVGVYETGNVFEDGGALIPLHVLQQLKHRIDELTIILVKAKPNADLNQLIQSVETTYKNELVTLRDLGEYNKNYQGAGLVRVGTWLISLLALFIGGIGVMNTMIMAVYERTREIGILRAVGWRRGRVLRMILGESLLLSAFAALVGTFMGLSAAWLVTQLPRAGGLIGPTYTPTLFAEALLIALVVGLLGGLYPAYRATQILPQEALRYE
ncbi:ABC transporter permease [Candidatus Acetothermia bacterium]|nr:ABC transporter permease [Candidatus Acetothermia bacterium]